MVSLSPRRTGVPSARVRDSCVSEVLQKNSGRSVRDFVVLYGTLFLVLWYCLGVGGVLCAVTADSVHTHH